MGEYGAGVDRCCDVAEGDDMARLTECWDGKCRVFRNGRDSDTGLVGSLDKRIACSSVRMVRLGSVASWYDKDINKECTWN